MSFSVVTNISSINAQATLDGTQAGLQRTLARLTSGLRINSAADDAAGLAVANRHKLDNTGLTIGIRSANDAISKLQIEDGAMNNIASLLDRALTLASQAASDTFTGSRTTLDSEFQSVLSEITRNAQAAGIETSNANLNARSVFVGNTQTSTSATVTYVSFALTTAVDAQGLGISTQNITNQANSATAITALQTAIGTLGTVQGRAGAAMNRLSFAISQAQTMSVSVRASESRIRDANINARSVFVGNTQTSTSATVTYVSFALTTAVDAQGLGISTQNITNQANSATAITALQTAIGTLGTVQGRAGAAMNRLSFAISQAQTMSVSVRASESRIRDANIAEEAAHLTKFNILTQSGLAALSQANSSSQSVLQLLR